MTSSNVRNHMRTDEEIARFCAEHGVTDSDLLIAQILVRTVQSILQRELMDLMIPRETRLRALPTVSGGLKGFDFIDISLEPNTVQVGDEAKLLVSIQWGTPITRGEFIPRATLKGPSSDMEFRFVETTTADDLAANKLTFAGEADAPQEPGQWRIIFDFGLFDGDYTTVLTTFSR